MKWYYLTLIIVVAIIMWTVLSSVFYNKFFKRFYDIVVSLLVIILFSWVYLLIALAVRIKLGKPIIFCQVRPGIKDKKTGQEKLFKLYKFRTMSNSLDENGKLLPDNTRLNKFGAWLRSSSLDELPEFFNILKGEMTLIGPRPQLVRDMAFMSDEQRERHNVRPGLSGLAQIRGRNTISWDKKLESDLEYLNKVSLFYDVKIVILTLFKVLEREGITVEGDNAEIDYGDYLLKAGKVTKEEYDEKQLEAKRLLENFGA